MHLASIAHLIGFSGSEDAQEELAALLPGPVLGCLDAAKGQATPVAQIPA